MNRFRSARLASLASVALGLAIASPQVLAVNQAVTPFSAVYAFGDSLSDNGNFFALTTATLGAGNALPQSGDYFQGRFSNGKTSVEYLAQNLGVPLFDFAVGGALSGTTNGAVAASTLAVVPQLLNTGVQSQVAGFQAMLGANPADSQALYFVWAGANDFFYQGYNQGVANSVVTNLVSSVTTLYGLGARHFLLPTLPGLGSTPEALATAVALGDPTLPFQLNGLSLAFNAGLTFAMGGLAPLLPGATLTMFDTFAAQQQVLANPGAFGLSNTTDACFSGYIGELGTQCPDASGYMFWDKVHPTTATAAILGAGMAAAVPEPSSMLLMAAGAVALLGLRRRQRAAA